MRRAKISGAAKRGVCVIGAGNWGTSLAHALAESPVPLLEVVTRRRRSQRAWPQVTLAAACLDAEVIWLCVPDHAIAQAAAGVARRARQLGRTLDGQTLVHSSGALPASALRAAEEAGARVAAVHPVMSFPTRKVVAVRGVLFGIEAADRATARKLGALVRRLEGKPFAIPAGSKALYHAAGTMASPLVVSALEAALETARLAGLDAGTARALVTGLARRSAENWMEHGMAASFSGPLARGDAETIRLHLAALSKHPIVAGVYQALAGFAVERLPVRRRSALRGMMRDASSRGRSAGE